ncbi:MAG: response regulator [Candidatus Riflebacteria bacterium]|nr:response regulator [Candidatus Riflebacteria bacterium]
MNMPSASPYSLNVLVVDHQPDSRDALSDIISAEGHSVLIARDGVEGQRLFERHHPDLVITDVHLPRLSGLELLANIRHTDPAALVVVLAAFGDVDSIIASLHLRATNFIQKPHRPAEVATLLRKYAAIIEARLYGAEILHMMSHQQFSMKIDNEIHLVPQITDFLVRATHKSLPSQSRMEVRLGLTELIANAIEHGNLEISYSEKTKALTSRDERALEELFIARRSNPVLGKRRASVAFSLTPTGCEWVVSDEGNGFDWKGLPDPLSPEHLMESHGRGIFLARFQFDEMEYIGSGNQVRLKKTIAADSPGSNSDSEDSEKNREP